MAQFCVIARARIALHLRADQRRSHLQAAPACHRGQRLRRRIDEPAPARRFVVVTKSTSTSWRVGIALLVASLSSPLVAAPFAYVPNQKSGTISVIDTATDTVTRTLSGQGALGKRLQAIDSDAK